MPDARQRILAAAGEIFAAHGFEGATVRMITERAGVNLAAVNYHFGDKAELYTQVLSLCRCSAQEAAGVCEWPEKAPAGERLRFCIERATRRMLNPDRPRWQRLIYAREMIEPSGMLGRVVSEQIAPEFTQLRETLDELTGRTLPQRELFKLGFSIIGQCLFYLQNGPLIALLNPALEKKPPTVEEIVDHVCQFSLNALRPAPPPPKKR